MNSEYILKTRICMQTHISLYGTVSGIREMVDWTGLTYEEVLPVYMAELKPKANELAS